MGDQLGRYKLIERIGSGGMAEIWKAKAQGPVGFEKIVAIKRVLPHLVTQGKFLDMFAEEARLAARLDHPNIVQVFDFGIGDSQEDGLYIAMEYVDGVNLSRLAKHDLPVDVLLYIGIEVAKGLAYAHAKTDSEGVPLEIVHRDVSPQNILVSHIGEVKIADFGIAKFAHAMSRTDPGIVKGKLAYMSPEQVKGKALSSQSDLFAFGLVLYELGAGRRLINDSSPVKVYEALNGFTGLTEQQRETVPSELRDTVERALQHAARDRHFSASDIEKELARQLGGRGPDARERLAEIVTRVHAEPPKVSSRAPTKATIASTVADAPEELEQPEPPPPPPPPQKRGTFGPSKLRWTLLAVSLALVTLGMAAFAIHELVLTPPEPSPVPSAPSTAIAARSATPSPMPATTTTRTPRRTRKKRRRTPPTSVVAVTPAQTATPKPTPTRRGGEPGGLLDWRTHFTLTVVDENKKPVSGARVYFCKSAFRTDANGVVSALFEVTQKVCEVQVYVGNQRVDRRHVYVHPRPGEPLEQTIYVNVADPPVAGKLHIVTLRVKPAGATVVIDGVSLGPGSGSWEVSVTEGAHQFVFTDGISTVKRRVTVEKAVRISVDMHTGAVVLR